MNGWIKPIRFRVRPFDPFLRFLAGGLHCSNICTELAGSIIIFRCVDQSFCIIDLRVISYADLFCLPAFLFLFAPLFFRFQSLQPHSVGCFIEGNHDLADSIFERVGFAIHEFIFPVNGQRQSSVPWMLPFGNIRLRCPGVFPLCFFIFEQGQLFSCPWLLLLRRCLNTVRLLEWQLGSFHEYRHLNTCSCPSPPSVEQCYFFQPLR